MDLSSFLGTYIFSLVVYFSLDILWLTRFAKNFYVKNIGAILRRNVEGKLAPRWFEAAIFYFLYVLGIVFFSIRMAVLSGGNWFQTTCYGVLFGFMAYATYDLTNRASLEVFPLKVVLADMAWGALVSGIVALSGFLFATAFLIN